MHYLKPDAKSLIWLGLGLFVAPRVISAVRMRTKG